MPALPFEALVALRFLREGRVQTALILGGIAAGVAVIIFLAALISGLQASIVARTLGTQAHVVIRPPEERTRAVLEPPVAATRTVETRAQRLRSIDQWEAMIPLIEAVPGVAAVSPMASGPAFAARGDASKSVALLGVDAARYLRVVRMDGYMVQGRFAVQGSDALIGTDLAKDLGVALGDKLRIRSAEDRDEVVTVTGIFDVGARDLNRRWIFIGIRLAQNLLDLAGGVSNIDVRVDALFDAEAIARRIEGQTGALAESWMQTNAQLLAALSNQTLTNRLIRAFVVLIVALGIASVLVVSVVQKSREIGILRAMGASRRAILWVFLLQGAILGAMGAAAGTLAGLALVRAFSGVFRNPDGTVLFRPEAGAGLILATAAVALAVGVLAAAIPARRAAGLDPVDAIRHG